MGLAQILYIIGIIVTVFVISGIIGYFFWYKKGYKINQEFRAKESHISKIVVQKFTGWFSIFALFTSVIIFIFCVTMISI